MLKKRYTCFNCGKRFHQSTTNGLVDAREQVECPECSALVDLASVEEVGLPRRVCTG
jgi:DNA-directed RNA polymerase subunit RPC12/RpoP